MADQIKLDGARHEADRLSRVINAVLKGKRSPGGSVADIGEAVLQVANKMGVDPEDIRKYGLGDPSSESAFDRVSGGPIEDTATAVLHVANMMGVDPEDIKKYGYREPSSESEAGPVQEENQGLDDPVSHIAKAMGNSPEDIKQFGY